MAIKTESNRYKGLQNMLFLFILFSKMGSVKCQQINYLFMMRHFIFI